MRLNRLALTDFRSYAELDLGLEPGVNVLIGPNGQGKTNIVEAVGFLAHHSSHRVAQEAPLVRAGAARAVIRGSVQHEERTALIELELNPGRANRARLNRSPVPRTRDVLGYLRTVLFAPEDLALVKGDPGERRRFLDELLVARAPRMAAVRADYDRAMKQRNALLRTAAIPRRAARSAGQPPELATLDAWDAHLAHAGAQLLAARYDLLAHLSPLIDKAYATIAGHGATHLEYRRSAAPTRSGGRSSGGPIDLDQADAAVPVPPGEGARPGVAELEAWLLGALADARPAELDRGVTLVGPHRDDLLLQLDSDGHRLPAKYHASHGESWSFALALKLASYELLRVDGIEPVLILDDVFAELDSSRRRHLLAVVTAAEQVLITAAVAQDVPEELEATRYRVSAGTAERTDD
ncbi:MAG TPA: DNA replication/repair protein RecF [Actinocrinis sp.]|nr:DNA replication/repair protein RecF [Actinocrinis sp.]